MLPPLTKGGLGGARQRDELVVQDRSRPGFSQGAFDPFQREVGGLTAEAGFQAFRGAKGDPEAQAMGLHRLGLFNPIAGDMGGVVEPDGQVDVGRSEHFGLRHAGLGCDVG